MNTTLDFAQLDTKSAADAGTEVIIDDPRSGEPLRNEGKLVVFRILGADSTKVRAFDREVTKKNLDRARRSGTVDITVESVEANRVDRLVTAMLGWENMPPLDGNQMDFTAENTRVLLQDPRFSWLLDQLERAMADRRRFFTKPSES